MNRFEFPKEIKTMLTEINNEKQWVILEYIIDAENSIPYTELREKLGYTSNEKDDFERYMKSLEISGWVQNKIRANTGFVSDKQSIRYNVSKFGLKVMEGAMSAMCLENYSVDSMSVFDKKKLTV